MQQRQVTSYTTLHVALAKNRAIRTIHEARRPQSSDEPSRRNDACTYDQDAGVTCSAPKISFSEPRRTTYKTCATCPQPQPTFSFPAPAPAPSTGRHVARGCTCAPSPTRTGHCQCAYDVQGRAPRKTGPSCRPRPRDTPARAQRSGQRREEHNVQEPARVW